MALKDKNGVCIIEGQKIKLFIKEGVVVNVNGKLYVKYQGSNILDSFEEWLSDQQDWEVLDEKNQNIKTEADKYQ